MSERLGHTSVTLKDKGDHSKGYGVEEMDSPLRHLQGHTTNHIHTVGLVQQKDIAGFWPLEM